MTKKQLEKIINGLKESLEHSEKTSDLLSTSQRRELAELCEVPPYITTDRMLKELLGTDKQERAIELYRHYFWQLGFKVGIQYALTSLELEEEIQED